MTAEPASRTESAGRKLLKALLFSVSLLGGLLADCLTLVSTRDMSLALEYVVVLWSAHFLAAVVLFSMSSARGRRFWPIYLVWLLVVALPVVEMAFRVL